MYKIIGADGKEYGPVTAEQVRQWIRERRADGHTKVQAEGETDWKALESVAEFGDVFGATVPAAVPPVGPPTLDIGNCVARSWALLHEHFWSMIGVTFLVGLLLTVTGVVLRIGVNFASGVTFQDIVHARGLEALRLQWRGILVSSIWFWIMTGPFFGGLYNYYLKLIRGQPAGLGDAFAGFGSQFGQLALGSLAVSVLTSIGFVFCIIPGIYLGVCWKFAFPAIIDKRVGFWEGMAVSRRAVTGRWWVVFALVLLAGLISVAGVVACCVGVLVTSPIGFCAIAYAYEDLIGVQVPATS